MIETVGHFRILEPLGRGPWGEVYRARDTHVGRTAAVTLVADEIVSTADRRQQFIEDARRAAAVSHPNIVTLYQAGDEQGCVYLAHEFVQGDTLRALIAGRAVNLRHAVDVASQLAEALADAHAAGHVHGAISPERVIITPRGHAKMADFGMSAWLPGSSGPAGGRGEEADLAAVGAMLFEMLTGRAPTPGRAVPSAANPAVPREIDPIVARALGLNGGYEAAATLAAELRAMGAMLDVRMDAADAAAPRRSHRAAGAARWLAIAAAAGALGAAALWYLRSA